MEKTSKEVCELLGLKLGKLIRLARSTGKTFYKGKFTYYTEDEVAAISKHRDYVDTSVRELKTIWMNGEVRYKVSAYDPSTGKRFFIPRSHYSYLNGTGDWEKGIYKIVSGCVVHHKDFNPLNDEFNNLELMTIGDHRRLHDSANPSRRNNSSIAMKEFWSSHPDFKPNAKVAG